MPEIHILEPDDWRDMSSDPELRELVRMWVAPSHRRRGFARILLERVKEWAAADGATRLRLGVRAGNEQAMDAYLRLGMRTSGERVREVGQPTKIIVIMECEAA